MVNNNRNVIIEDINFDEALRYMGYGNQIPDDTTKELLLLCAKQLKEAMEPKFTYKVFDLVDGQIPNSEFKLEGRQLLIILKTAKKWCLCVQPCREMLIC